MRRVQTRLYIKEQLYIMERILMNLKEVCEYTGWGETKVREILKRPSSTFTVMLGNRLYVNKKLFDDYLNRCAKYHISV